MKNPQKNGTPSEKKNQGWEFRRPTYIALLYYTCTSNILLLEKWPLFIFGAICNFSCPIEHVQVTGVPQAKVDFCP